MGLNDSAEGFADFLAGGAGDLESIVFPTDIDNLSVMAAGQPVDHFTELLASSRAGSSLSQLAQNDPDRVIVIDSAPLLMTTEAEVLARLVGQVVFVVSAGQTPQEVVKEGISRLTSGPNTSILLNRVRRSQGRGYYGYGQYSGQRTSNWSKSRHASIRR